MEQGGVQSEEKNLFSVSENYDATGDWWFEGVRRRDRQIHNEKTGSYLNEPMHGARPRQTGREGPPVIDNRQTMDATGGAAVRKPGRTLLLSPGRRILMVEEVITPPRGGGGGRPAPEPQGAPRGVRAVPEPFPDDFSEDSLRDGGLRQKDIESPVDMLVDTVSVWRYSVKKIAY